MKDYFSFVFCCISRYENCLMQLKKAFTAISKSEFENDRLQAKNRNDECSLVLSVLSVIFIHYLWGLNLKMIDWLETHDKRS